ncbi:hypothetical protein C9374_011134 [Naegleria lovaniensis]|uniref:Uncharacterized protein n=1 Tax=Naegleria lovaniensis TaxID=51637 RepID=A0AA88G9U2_NAELO|nr:uncharacterized protein C9374_011134 [Naegleria lovaniensis]KAG2374055.1 hypothetical protein C9374_011134 [Naegleria lovaniensis]
MSQQMNEMVDSNVVEERNIFWKRYFIEKIANPKFMSKTSSKRIVKPALTFSLEYISKHYVETMFSSKVSQKDTDDDGNEDQECEIISNAAQFFWSPFPQYTGKSIESGDDYIALGESKVGGYPDFPRDFEWPKDENGEEWIFAAQINVRQLEYYSFSNSGILNQGGMIYFLFPKDATGCRSYWGLRKQDHQPVTYLSSKQITEMGGLERRIPVKKKKQQSFQDSSLTSQVEELHDDDDDDDFEFDEEHPDHLFCSPNRMVFFRNVGFYPLFGRQSLGFIVENQHCANFTTIENHDYFHVNLSNVFGSPFSLLPTVMGLPETSIDKNRLYVNVMAWELDLSLLPSDIIVFQSCPELEFKMYQGLDHATPVLHFAKTTWSNGIYLSYSLVENWNVLHGTCSFLYRLANEEEQKTLTQTCEYLKADQRFRTLGKVLDLDAYNMNLKSWCGEGWMFFLPFHYFELNTGPVKDSYVLSFDP